MPKSNLTGLRAQLMAASRWKGAQHPHTVALRAELAVAVATQRLHESIDVLQEAAAALHAVNEDTHDDAAS